MHTIYEKLWLISSELNHLTKVNKKSLYMAISVMFWILVATIVCVVLEIFCKISYITLAVIIGYVAVIPDISEQSCTYTEIQHLRMLNEYSE